MSETSTAPRSLPNSSRLHRLPGGSLEQAALPLGLVAFQLGELFLAADRRPHLRGDANHR